MHTCKSGSCSVAEESTSHHRCGCQHHQCHCQCDGGCACCHGEVEDDYYDRAHHLLELADEAWMEVLKEKIKEHIRATDHKIDEIAKIVTAANRAHWYHKMGEGKILEAYERQLSELFDRHEEHKEDRSQGQKPSGGKKGWSGK